MYYNKKDILFVVFCKGRKCGEGRDIGGWGQTEKEGCRENVGEGAETEGDMGGGGGGCRKNGGIERDWVEGVVVRGAHREGGHGERWGERGRRHTERVGMERGGGGVRGAHRDGGIERGVGHRGGWA